MQDRRESTCQAGMECKAPLVASAVGKKEGHFLRSMDASCKGIGQACDVQDIATGALCRTWHGRNAAV